MVEITCTTPSFGSFNLQQLPSTKEAQWSFGASNRTGQLQYQVAEKLNIHTETEIEQWLCK